MSVVCAPMALADGKEVTSTEGAVVDAPRKSCLTIEQVTTYFKQFEENRRAQTEPPAPPKEFIPPSDVELRNLHLFQRSVSELEVDQISSNFQRDIFDPHGYAASEYHEALLKEQKRAAKEQEDKRTKAKTERKRQEQAEAEAKAKEAAAQAEGKRKRSRWGGTDSTSSQKPGDQKVLAAVAAAQAAVLATRK
jgi:hypothetical protein